MTKKKANNLDALFAGCAVRYDASDFADVFATKVPTFVQAACRTESARINSNFLRLMISVNIRPCNLLCEWLTCSHDWTSSIR